jgi:hypothetical protein
MRRSACFLLLIILVTTSAAFSDDQEKAEKQARKITAMATDKTGRCMVSMSIADKLKVERPAMVADRRRMGLDYGSFFVAQELLAGGAQMTQLISQLRAGKTIWQIGIQEHANWGQIAADAKRQNGKIEDYIYRHFLNKKNTEADQLRDLQDKYDPQLDAVRTDFMVTPQEMVDAQARYIFWRDQAGKGSRSGPHMTPAEEHAANMDHADTRHDTNGVAAPSAGGIPTN